MPVIRSDLIRKPKVFSNGDRLAFIETLKNELSGKVSSKGPSGPVIFEIPLVKSNQFDVIVVWDAWDQYESEDRSKCILDAYGKKKNGIAQALGVTYREAVSEHLLPYAVVPMAPKGEAKQSEFHDAMIREGGFELSNGKVDLRLPTMNLAEQVHRNLCEKIPNGYWSIVQAANGSPFN